MILFMKKKNLYWAGLLSGTVLSTAASAQQSQPVTPDSTRQNGDPLMGNWQPEQQTDPTLLNRIALSLRLGLNIGARFSGIGLPPGGAANGYYDGYVVTASPPNTSPNPNYTTYWGYDSASQLLGSPGNYTGVAFHSAAAVGGATSASSGGSDVYPGFEFSYDRQLLERKDWHDMRFGCEAAVNYMRISMSDSSAFGVNVTETDYNFPIAIPQPPPFNDGGAPGQPALQVPGTGLAPVAGSVLAQDSLDADLWGFRLGPYAELPLTKKLYLRASGGLAFGLLDSSVSWKEKFAPTGGPVQSISGGGSDFSVLCGGYISVDADYRFNPKWDVEAAVQFQDLGTYSHNFGSRSAELDLSQSVYLEVGVSYSF